MACKLCIPTGGRNKWINRCTNLWSILVVLGLALGLAGAALNYMSTQKITNQLYNKVQEQLDMLNRIGNGQVSPAEVELFVAQMPAELKEKVDDSLRELEAAGTIDCSGPDGCLSAENLNQLAAAGYSAEDLPEDWEQFDPSADFETSEYFPEDEMASFDACYDIERRCNREDTECQANVCDPEDWECWERECWPVVEQCWAEYDACWMSFSNDFANENADPETEQWNHDDDHHRNQVRRRLFSTGGLPKPGAIRSFKTYQQYGLIALVVVGLLGPLFTTVGMIFFCCMLKALSDEKEGKCESCCGTISGCVIFPVVYILGLVFSIFAALFMNIMCVFLAAPIDTIDIMMRVHGAALGVAKGDAAPASLMPLLGDILPMLRGSVMTAVNGDLCKLDRARPSYLMTQVLDYDPTDCNSWLMSYRFGFASQIVCAVASVFGILITFYVGYKACCRNNRGTRKTDIEMA